MSNVQLVIKDAPGAQVIRLDRAPSPGEYITWPKMLLKVVATLLVANNPSVHAVVYAEVDPDGRPDEIGVRPKHL